MNMHTSGEFGRKDGGGAPAPEPDIKTLAAGLKTATDEVKTFAEKAAAEMKRLGDVTAETKENADKALAKQSEFLTQLADIEQKLARRGQDPEGQRTIGQQVVAADAVKAFAGSGSVGTIRIPVKAITSAPGSAGGMIAPDRQAEIIGLPRRELRVRDLLMPGRTNSNAVDYARQTTRTNNAAVVAENTAKPESDYVWAEATANVRTIAHWVPVSRNTMDDAPQLETIIDGELRYGLDLAEDGELLNGDGTGQHLHGLIPQATAYAAPFDPAGTETAIDILRLGLLQATLNDYQADGIVLHPTDWARVELTKDADGRYIWANPTAVNQKTLWGRPVVDTTSISVDKFLVGAFKAAAQIFDRMDTEVLISSEDRDNFIKNMLTVRAERRLALAVRRPAALIYGDLGFVA